MKEREMKYWPKDKPIPEGWLLVNDLSGCHHGAFSVLIEKITGTKDISNHFD